MEELAEKERLDKERQKSLTPGVSAVQNAVAEGQLQLVKAFIASGLSPETTNDNGETLFLLAASHGRLQIMKSLAYEYEVDVNAQTAFGGTRSCLLCEAATRI